MSGKGFSLPLILLGVGGGWDTDGWGDYTCTIHQPGPGWVKSSHLKCFSEADSDICSTHEH